jgi:hypothetical protein
MPLKTPNPTLIIESQALLNAEALVRCSHFSIREV